MAATSTRLHRGNIYAATPRQHLRGYTDDEATLFKNQGDCVSCVAIGGTNKAEDDAVTDQLLLEAGAFD